MVLFITSVSAARWPSVCFVVPSSSRPEVKMVKRGALSDLAYEVVCADPRLDARLGYNHASECRPITSVELVKVKAKKSSGYLLETGLVKL